MYGPLCTHTSLGLPDPFAVLTIDGEQTRTTPVMKHTLSPYWNASFQVQVRNTSVIAVQVFDQRKFKKSKDQGFLGVVNVLMSSVFDLNSASQADGIINHRLIDQIMLKPPCRDDYSRVEEVECEGLCPRQAHLEHQHQCCFW